MAITVVCYYCEGIAYLDKEAFIKRHFRFDEDGKKVKCDGSLRHTTYNNRMKLKVVE
jgi:hypothetical protein